MDMPPVVHEVVVDREEAKQAVSRLLPEDFKVYTASNGVGRYGAGACEEKILPTFNHYLGDDGGYVAIYTRDPKGSVYSVGNDIYVVGQIRVPGHYEGRIFIPEGYKAGDNITRDENLVAIAESYLPEEMKYKVWVGGDTGGWFGL
ncbi:MAG: hypothetical protein SP1CHLAM54_03470 [Chlamydiia bacterium]|nr:hypothetical protein [Chlamydiia bacterium]MCH9615263.1 hypothetical protein [Chlamydiia bacterium]MCH9628415.1 hypothetical protein [Chlamydiia bacterium]